MTHSQSNKTALNSQALAAPQPLVSPIPSDGGSQCESILNRLDPSLLQQSEVPACRETPSSQPSTIDLPSTPNFLELARPGAKPRNGKIAHLPHLERDLVNRMLANNLPHRAVVMALGECGFQVTERNVSNWKTRGGYQEWCAAQERALELRTFQDNLTGFLRRHDASELPEVGLQSAATSLSAVLLRPDLIRELISEPEKYSKLIEIQCRLAREIQTLQKDRDDAAKALSPKFSPERLKRHNEEEVESIRKTCSSRIGNGPRDPDIPHRNFIPKELEPVPPTHEVPAMAVLQQLKSTLLARRPTPAPASGACTQSS